MSEEFDREAEKEQLRQQLEAEESSRRNTEHLSELLLKGATMTNRHCEECGDPIFRYEGREFCPTCQREVGDNGRSAAENAPSEDSTDAPGEPDRPSTEQARRGVPATTETGRAPGGDADLEAVRASLTRKLTALAQEAEAATDVRRTRSLLGATREAAEALQAVENLNQ